MRLGIWGAAQEEALQRLLFRIFDPCSAFAGLCVPLSPSPSLSLPPPHPSFSVSLFLSLSLSLSPSLPLSPSTPSSALLYPQNRLSISQRVPYAHTRSSACALDQCMYVCMHACMYASVCMYACMGGGTWRPTARFEK